MSTRRGHGEGSIYKRADGRWEVRLSAGSENGHRTIRTRYAKTQREAVARALGEVDQTRTWNLLIDVIAQSGKYAPGETNLRRFNVEGEQRYWVRVAIDRFTGQVIDKQIEVVNE